MPEEDAALTVCRPVPDGEHTVHRGELPPSASVTALVIFHQQTDLLRFPDQIGRDSQPGRAVSARRGEVEVFGEWPSGGARCAGPWLAWLQGSVAAIGDPGPDAPELLHRRNRRRLE